MPPWHVFHPDHEFPGQVLIDLKNAVGSADILPYFEKYGLADIDAKAWYPMEQLLKVYNDMAETNKSGMMYDFVSIGMKEAEQAFVPPEFQSLSLLSILQGSGEVFKLNNRGTDPGGIECETITDHHVKLTLRAPTPDDLWYGIFYGYVRRFLPKGTYFKLYYDPEVPHRDVGGDKTIIHITWA